MPDGDFSLYPVTTGSIAPRAAEHSQGEAMLYFTLLVAIAFYGMLYLLWLVMEPHLGQPTAMLLYFRQKFFFQPNAEVMAQLKWLVIIVGVYLVMDLAVSIMRRYLRKQGRRPQRKTTRSSQPTAPSRVAHVTQGDSGELYQGLPSS
jgi:hypothetical protein